jgi:hypothetical protein
MRERRLSWFERLIAHFSLETVRHRTCRICHKRILRAHKYRHVKVGPFLVDQIEHKNCANPTLETPYQLAQRLMDVLPFDGPALEGKPINRESFHPLPKEDEPFVDGTIFPSYGDAHQEKIQ